MTIIADNNTIEFVNKPKKCKFKVAEKRTVYHYHTYECDSKEEAMDMWDKGVQALDHEEKDGAQELSYVEEVKWQRK